MIFISLKNVTLQCPVIAENLEATGCSHFTNFKANGKAPTCKLPSLSGPAEGLLMLTACSCASRAPRGHSLCCPTLTLGHQAWASPEASRGLGCWSWQREAEPLRDSCVPEHKC